MQNRSSKALIRNHQLLVTQDKTNPDLWTVGVKSGQLLPWGMPGCSSEEQGKREAEWQTARLASENGISLPDIDLVWMEEEVNAYGA